MPADVLDTAQCVVPGCRRRAANGWLCRHGDVGERRSPDYVDDGGHFEQLSRWLSDILTEVGDLSPIPRLEIRLDSGGSSSTLASERAPAVLEVIVATDARSTAHGRTHHGPVCQRCPSLVGARCTCPTLEWRRDVHWVGCPRYGVHPSCVAILADRDEVETRSYRLLSVDGVLRGWADEVRAGRIIGRPAETYLDCVDRAPGTPRHGPAYGLSCRHPSCSGVTWERTVPVVPTLKQERAFLARHLDWLVQQDDIAVDFYREIGELRAQLRAVNRNTDERPLSGWCYRIIDDQGTVCGGSMWPEYEAHTSGGEDDDGRRRPREVVCGRNDSHRWKGGRYGDLAELYASLERQRRQDNAAPPPPASTPPPPPAAPTSTGLERPDRLLGVVPGPSA